MEMADRSANRRAIAIPAPRPQNRSSFALELRFYVTQANFVFQPMGTDSDESNIVLEGQKRPLISDCSTSVHP